MNKITIGLIGYKSSGKSTAGAYLDHLNFVRVHPAETLRKMLVPFLADLGFDSTTIQRMLEGDLKRLPIRGLEDQTPTTLQQTLGTEWGRERVQANIWNLIWKLRSAPHPKVYNDSIRFPNEANMLLDQNGILIKLDRPGLDLSDLHESERHIANLPYHFKLYNGGTVQELYEQMETILRICRISIPTLIYPEKLDLFDL